MTKRAPKTRGARPGSGPKPKLGNGNVRTVIKTIRLSTGEHEAQQAAVRRGGIKDWAEWARPILNLAAAATNGNAQLDVGDRKVDTCGTVDEDPVDAELVRERAMEPEHDGHPVVRPGDAGTPEAIERP